MAAEKTTAKTLKTLAFDLGADSGRAVVGAFDGENLTLEEVHRFPNPPVAVLDGLHWDTLRLWKEIIQGVRLAVQKHGPLLASIGLDTWGVDFGLLAADDSLIGNPFHYRDRRTDGMMEKAFAIVPQWEIYRRTGIQFLQLNSIYQLLAMVLAKSPALNSAKTFLNTPDLFNFWLCGRKASEATIASTTQLLDPVRGDWSRELMQRLGIPTHIFCEIIPSGTNLGEVRPLIAEEAGCRRTLVIAPGGHDTASAVVAVPLETADALWVSSGTWSIIGVELKEPIITRAGMQAGMTNEGGVNHTTRFCTNIVALWLVQECRRKWLAEGKEYTYDDITKMAEQAPPFTSLIHTGDKRFLAPGDVPARIQAYCREKAQRVPETHAAILRCIFESLALSYRSVADNIEGMVGRKLPIIHAVGGGSRNRLLNQFTANATRRTVIAGPTEATATGNLLMQLISLGELASLEEARTLVRRSSELQVYTPRNTSAWDDAYQRYQKEIIVKA